MKTTLWLVCFLLVASASSAQVVVTDHLGFDQAAPTLPDANRYVYLLSADGGAGVAAKNAACTGTTSPFLCVVDYPALTPGAHTITATATDGTLTSAPSVPFGFTFVIVPVAPQNLRNIKKP